MAFTKADKNRYMSLGQYWWQRLPQLVEMINSGTDFEAAKYGSPEWVLANDPNFEDAARLAERIVDQGYGGSRADTINATAFFAGQVNTIPPPGSEIVQVSQVEQQPQTATAAGSTIASGVRPGQIIGAEQGLGTYGQGLIIAEDGSGFYSAISPETLEKLRADGVVPTGIDPSLLQPAELIRLQMQGAKPAPLTKWGDTQGGFAVELIDGNIVSSSTIPEAGTPTFIGNNNPSGAPAGSGIDDTSQPPPTSASVQDPIVPEEPEAPFTPSPNSGGAINDPLTGQPPVVTPGSGIPPSGGNPSGGGSQTPGSGSGGGSFSPSWNWGEGYGAPSLDGGGGYDPDDYLFDRYVPGQESPWGVPDVEGGNKDFYRNQFMSLLSDEQNFRDQQRQAAQLRDEAENNPMPGQALDWSWTDLPDVDIMESGYASPLAGMNFEPTPNQNAGYFNPFLNPNWAMVGNGAGSGNTGGGTTAQLK